MVGVDPVDEEALGVRRGQRERRLQQAPAAGRRKRRGQGTQRISATALPGGTVMPLR